MDTSKAAMHAVRIHQFGGPEVLKYEFLPRPKPGRGEVLIRVEAASVNPVDAGIRQGSFKAMVSLPVVPGCDVAGVIEQVGPGVEGLEAGDPVFAMVGLSGGYAEYVVTKADFVAQTPGSLDFVEAAAVPLASLTAWQALFEVGNLEAGQKVLIQGASGGVGSFAVQFAHQAGATVFATVSQPNVDYTKSLGADEVIDYTSQRFEDTAKEVDLVIDLVGGETRERSFGILKPGGLVVTALGAGVEDREQLKKVFVHPDGKQLQQISSLIDRGEVTVVVSETFPLTQASEAQKRIQTRHTRGKIVLTVENAA